MSIPQTEPESGAVELGVEGSEKFSADTALLNELHVAPDLEVSRENPRSAGLHIGCS
jgi:hypothetical protein